MTKQTICFVAGKSGGHIIPCLTLATTYKTINNNLNVIFFSTTTNLDKVIVSDNALISTHIMLPLCSASITSIAQFFIVGWNMFYSIFVSFFYLFKQKPSEIISTGGVVALPVCLAAYILRIPITLYNLDVVPGKAIKALTPFASKIMVCFKSSQKFFPPQKCTFTAYPVRYITEQFTIDQYTAQQQIGLDPNKKTILILGGSQGSLSLNRYIKEWINSSYFSSTNTQIIHQTGSSDSTNWKKLYKDHNITAHVFSYHHHLASLYIAADSIICRAGAGTLFEIAFFKKQCLVIPLKTNTTTHQIDNARTMCQEHPKIFQWIDQDDVEKNIVLFFLKINKLLDHQKI